jgi:hypothetical protein
MKRIVLLTVLCFTLMVAHAQFGKWQVYPLLGADLGVAVPFPLSDIPKGARVTPKPTPNLGIGLGYHLFEKWDIGFEASYHILDFSAKADVRSQPFYFDDHRDVLYFSGKTSTHVRLRFLEFPLLVVYTINPHWSVEPGIYYSRILDGSFSTKGIDGILSNDKAITDTGQLPGIANTSYNFNDFIDVWDAGLLIGTKYHIKQRFCFWGRMQIGFKSLFVKEFTNIDYKLYQVRLNVGVSYTLFSN